MESVPWLPWVLAAGALVAALSSYPYTATAIAYRGSDNGLAYILLVMGVAVWNAMFAAQLLDPDALVTGFFLSLSIVSASLDGLGWFLFAGTASSTTTVPRRRLVYGVASVLVGANVFLVVTSPTHELYWRSLSEASTAAIFAEIDPRALYWLHTLFLVGLFGAGTLLFFDAWRIGISPRYTCAYTIAGSATVLAIVGSNVAIPGGVSVAPLAAASLTTIGWIQANRGRPLTKYRPHFRFEGLSR